MSRIATLAIAAATAALASTVPSHTQQTVAPEQRQQQQVMMHQSFCGDRTEIVASLSKDFQESRLATGLMNQDAVVEVFASGNGSWTILATRTDGLSCILSSGEGWDSMILAAGTDV